LSGLIIVDTSIFIDFLRADSFSNKERASLFDQLIIDDRIILSEVVKLELLMGVRKAERFALARMLGFLRKRGSFPTSKKCEELLGLAKNKGLTLGIPDLMILAETID